VYFQDDWKISSKLTVNPGQWVEHETPITERYNRGPQRSFWQCIESDRSAGAGKLCAEPDSELPVSQFRVLGGLTFAGVDGNSREYWEGQSRPGCRDGLAIRSIRRPCCVPVMDSSTGRLAST
jgi:hypothetical protein